MNPVAHVSWYAGVRVSLGIYQKVEWLVRGCTFLSLLYTFKLFSKEVYQFTLLLEIVYQFL